MTPPGRPRKAPPNLPSHIDYNMVPKGIYWDRSGRGRWYVLDRHPDGRGFKSKTVAQANARLSDLHIIAEQRLGSATRGSIAYVIDLFETSLTFSHLASSTQRHYRDYAAVLQGVSLEERREAWRHGDRQADPRSNSPTRGCYRPRAPGIRTRREARARLSNEGQPLAALPAPSLWMGARARPYTNQSGCWREASQREARTPDARSRGVPSGPSVCGGMWESRTSGKRGATQLPLGCHGASLPGTATWH